MGVRLVDETFEEEPATQTRLRLLEMAPSPHDRDEQPTRPKPPHTREDVAELMATLARILGFRLQLLLAFLGAIGLGAYAAVDGGIASGVAAGAYDILIFLPILHVAKQRG